jgi:hypothetical protein
MQRVHQPLTPSPLDRVKRSVFDRNSAPSSQYLPSPRINDGQGDQTEHPFVQIAKPGKEDQTGKIGIFR